MNPHLTAFDTRFRLLDQRSRELLGVIGDAEIYRRPRDVARELMPFSVGEYVLRSAAMVESTFGGITTRLWDDPFEWTLPEKLATRELILEYLDEVEKTRREGFAFLKSDDSLARSIPSPEKLRPILDILLECLARAEHYQGRAFAFAQVLTDAKLPRL